MKTVGIIAEYNPFHNGHAYHIAEAKRITGADYAIVVMSGDFVQRGTPAIWDKYTRTKAALLGGADVVFELPVCYATASAEYFAEGAVSLLDALGVDTLCFGSESGDLAPLQALASLLLAETPLFQSTLNTELSKGLSYPAARALAIKTQLESEPEHTESNLPSVIDLPCKDLDAILYSPNNLLGIEYCKALLARNSKLVPFTLKRIGNAYHENDIETESFASATALRKLIENRQCDSSELQDKLISQVPSSVFTQYREVLSCIPALSGEHFSQLLRYAFLQENNASLSLYSDWSEDLANRLLALPYLDLCFAELAAELKSKQLTLTRVNRMLLHVLLNITEDKIQEARSNGSAFYARLLGLRESSSAVLRHLESKSHIPMINRLAPATKELNGIAATLLMDDIRAAELYRMVQQSHSHLLVPNEFTRGIVRI